MGLFKKETEEWELVPDDYDDYGNYIDFEDTINEPPKNTLPPKEPKKKQLKIHKEKKPKKSKEKPKKENTRTEDTYTKEQIDYLERGNGYEYSYRKDNKINYTKMAKIPLIIISTVLIISGIGVIGYINTDFDSEGNAYTIPLDVHYKRKYATVSDDVLDLVNSFDDKAEIYIDLMDENYLQTTDELTTFVEQLKLETNELSRYTNVPKEFSAYNTSLLNFSILTQEYIEELIANYNKANYKTFAKNGLKDFRNYLEEVNNMRRQIDSLLFKNMEG